MENMLSTLAPAVTAELYNATNATVAVSPLRHGGKMFGVIVKVVYAIGIIGNAAAIVALRRGERRVRNKKHLLLLTSLAANDLVALVGMVCAMVVSEQVPGARNTRLYCVARVLLRIFGVGSVCIAVTMALERYLALTRPFLYQKQVTYYVIRTALLVSWLWAAALTCAPVFGLGLYYDEANHCCTRYRNAVTTIDFSYAVFYVFFGTVLCAVLVYCNLAVIRALYAITLGSGAVRRVSRSSCIGGATPRNQIEPLAELLLALNRAPFCEPGLAAWLRQALDVDGFPTPHATRAHKHKFITAVVKEKNSKRRILETVQEFSLVCRGLIGTEYARQTLASKQLVA